MIEPRTMDCDEGTAARTPDMVRGDAAMAAVILLLAGFLTAAGSRLAQGWQESLSRREATSYEDLLGIAATLAGVLVLSWWIVSILGAITAAVLERSGRTRAAATAGKLSPAFMRRLALAALGIQLVTAPLANASVQSGLPGTVGTDHVAAAVWSERSDGDTAGVDPRWKPQGPASVPGPLTPRQLRADAPATESSTLTVRAGDTLWGLTAASLGPFASDVEIAMAWPRLYESNKAVIGDNPHLLHPGQILRIPPRS